MGQTVAQKLISSHLVSGRMVPGEPIELVVDQTMAQDATGTLVMLDMPVVMGVKLTGQLPPWVSAKDVILEMLRRHSVKGGLGKIIEYYGPGLVQLSAMDRHVIANMGQELGATTSVFPADAVVERFLRQQERAADFEPLTADPDACYDEYDAIDLSALEPLIACPSSPDKVVPVRAVAGRKIYQSYIGSSANPGLRDFEVPAHMVAGRRIAAGVSFDVNPTSRQMLENLVASGALMKLLHAGARLHQTGCNGCIGMGQAPATGRISLRTVPRNFPGRSGTEEDQVYLCSPETATASALTGEITDPRDLGMDYPQYEEPERIIINRDLLVPPVDEGREMELERGPNIRPLPEFAPVGDQLEGPVLLKAGNNVSTDAILPAGVEVLPLRSNIPEISKHTFRRLDPDFYEQARRNPMGVGFVIGGTNYGQGSSREHAAMAPAYLGVRCVVARSFARIHRCNLINFGVIPLLFADDKDADAIELRDVLHIDAPLRQLASGRPVKLINRTTHRSFWLRQDITAEELATLLAGGLINRVRQKLHAAGRAA